MSKRSKNRQVDQTVGQQYLVAKRDTVVKEQLEFLPADLD